MKHNFDFKADRVLARHCDELMARAAPKFDRAEAAQTLMERVCKDLAERMRAHLLGSRPILTFEAGESKTGDALMRSIGRSAANYFGTLGTSGANPGLLVSFDLENAARLTDRLFGGDGSQLDETPTMLAMSSALALQRVAEASMASFAQAADLIETEFEIQHNSEIARLAPFARGSYCFAWDVTLKQDELGPWSMTLAILENELDALLKRQSSGEHNPAPAIGAKAVFDAIPLSASAILAELRLPLAKLSTLQPGDILPVVPQREVPLFIGELCIAQGRVGSLDERLALQLTKINGGGPFQ